MKKNKGFTLIELLAVIVVLAIIALIATPIVMNTIKNSKKGAAESSASSYIKQVETAIVENRVQTGNTISDGTYEINSDGNICLNNDCTETLAINMNGNKPSSGTITIKNGQVETASNMIAGDYKVNYTSSDNKYVVTEYKDSASEPSTDPTPETEVLCYSDNGEDSYSRGSLYHCDLGDENTKDFYVLETNEDTVSLILNVNIDEEGKGTEDYQDAAEVFTWEAQDSYVDGIQDIQAYLESATENWTKLDSSQISLPTAYQIIGDHDIDLDYNPEFNIGTDWLTTNLEEEGYWTSTEYTAGNGETNWVVCTGSGLLTSGGDNAYGVRPVITISKTQLGG